MDGGEVSSGQLRDRFVVVVGDGTAASLVAQGTDDETHVSRRAAVPDRVTDEPVDGLVIDADRDWRSLVADGEPPVPTVLLAHEETPVAEAVSAGITDCVRRSDPAVATLVGRRLSNALATDSTQTEQVRRREWLAAVLRHSTDSMSVLARDGTALYNSPSVGEQLGYDPEELRGQNLLDHVHPDDRAATEATFGEAIEQPDGTYATATYRRQHADGSWRWIEAVVNVQLDNPRVNGLILNRRDVTERERQRQRLREQEAYVESLLDAQPDVFYTLNTDGFFSEWNARLSTTLGYDDEELSEMHALDVIVPEDREMIMAAMTTVYHDGEPQQRETAFQTSDGETVPYQLNGAPLTDGDGEIVGLVGTGRDISGRVRREERLSVLNRVLRHNLRNRTNVVIGHAEQLADQLDGPAADHAETIREVGRDLDRLGVLARKVDRALDGRVNTVSLTPADVVDNALSASPGEVSVAEPPDVRLSALDSLSDALGELLDNAVRHNPAQTPRVEIGFDVTPRQVAIHVADDGPPIPDHEIDVLADGESRLEHGGGLGLWFVNWVVDASGGELSFDDSELGGNRVTLAVPRMRGES